MIFSTLARVAVLFFFWAAAVNPGSAWEPVRAHPLNPYVVEFRGKPTLLRTFGPAYEWLFDSSLTYTPYMDVFHRDGMNLTRIWCIGYPAWTPEHVNQPWPRATTGANALDGLKKWDLSKWNEDYFIRLKAIAQAASDRGIVVEFTFLSVFYSDLEWQKSPFHPSNNVQGYGASGNRYDSMRQNSANASLMERQTAAVRRIVRELNGFDNVIFEIQNEPFWNEENVKDDEEVAFHNSMLAAIRDEEATLQNRHLVAHNFPQQMAAMSADFDILNEHYPAAVPNTTIAGAEALLSNHYSRGKILSLDETNTINEAQTRLEAWMFFIGGGGIYDGLDYEGKVYTEADPSGDTPLGASIRGTVRNAATYMERMHLVALRRNLAWVTGGIPSGARLQASANPGQQYVAYLHHGQSGGANFQLNYNPINSSNHNASLNVTLPAGTWRAVWTRPADLVELHVQSFTHTGGPKTLQQVTYQADVALCIDRTGSGDTTPPPAIVSLAALANANGSVSLSWSPVQAFDLASYHVYRSTTPGVPIDPSHRIGTLPAATASFTDQPDSRGVVYHYAVTAVDQQENESFPSPEASTLSTPPVALSVTAEHGTVEGSGLYELNSTTTLTVTPNPGYMFTDWSGDVVGVDNPLSVVMDGNKSITANFVPDPTDSDGDGVLNEIDAFPQDPGESVDTDNDGIGNNADPDDDGDSVLDENDAFPLNAAETADTDDDGIGNNADLDDDGDNVPDETDTFPLDATESVDTDNDGIGNNADTDDDGDGVPDENDAFPLNAVESVDTDNDSIGNNADADDDGDGVPDENDAFPINAVESVDTDNDGVGNNADTDDDGDGVPDENDAFSLNAAESVDTDNDSIGNNADADDDGDSVPDEADAFPLNAVESVDTDNDGVGNNADTDDDGDGVPDETDAFPLNAAESVDTDNDGFGNNADTDDDGDSVLDEADAFPLNAAESVDTDNDGFGNNADTDDDGDGVPDETDVFPLNAIESVDTDGDGIGNNADPDDDGDGVPDANDAFPLDTNESVDTDTDGVGNNADTDDDGDGVPDETDAFPLNSSEGVDTDNDSIGNNADTDDDGDGVPDETDAFPLDATESVDTDSDGIGNNADLDDDGDGAPDETDIFPLDATETRRHRWRRHRQQRRPRR